MSPPRSRKRHLSRPGNRRGQEGQKVGYCHPPKHSRFKPGHSGNPKGRPKGSKNETTIWRSILNRKIVIREGGRERKVTVLEALMLKSVEDGLKGNVKALAFVLNRYRFAESDAPPENEISQDDREVIESFLKRLGAEPKTDKE
jgi:hypothetical protein